MDKSIRGKVFNQWLADLPQLVISAIGVKKSKMNKNVEKELLYLVDRRDKAFEELRAEFDVATNQNTLLVRPTKFPWINDFIKAAEEVMKKNPGGGDYLSPVAQNFIELCNAQIMLAIENKNKFAEREWSIKRTQLSEIRNKLEELAKKRSDICNRKDDNVDSSDTLFISDTKDMEDFNQKYFRPSCLPALNIRNLNDLIIKIHEENPSQVAVPKELMISPINTIINYYSLLREATAVEEGVGCGTVGIMKLPYPIAYNFLSANYQKRLSYEEYLKSFKSISHINLIKALKYNQVENAEIKKTYYIELELISPSGSFEYSLGIIDLIKEGDQYKIDNIETAKEDYFCAPYHLWQHNAELKVDVMYGNWCKLIAIRYPTIQTNYKKNIYIKGTDGNNYLFTFIKLTNGTDVEMGQYKQSNSGEWIPANINPYSCLRITPNFSGTWKTTRGILEITDSGNTAKGIYTYTPVTGPKYQGRIEGIVSGNTMTGTWSESKYPGHFRSGKFRFVLLPGGDHFHGTWGYDEKFEGHPWDGQKMTRSTLLTTTYYG